MALSLATIPLIIRSLLAARGADVSNLRNPRIIAAISPALETMAYRVARGPDYRGLQTDFNGQLPVAGWLSSMSSTLIFDLTHSVVYDSFGGELLIPVDSLHTLQYGNLPTGPVYYAQEAHGLRFRNTNGSLNTYADEVTITANYIPALGQVPVEYEGLFFDTLAELLTTQPESRAQELSLEGRA